MKETQGEETIWHRVKRPRGAEEHGDNNITKATSSLMGLGPGFVEAMRAMKLENKQTNNWAENPTA